MYGNNIQRMKRRISESTIRRAIRSAINETFEDPEFWDEMRDSPGMGDFADGGEDYEGLYYKPEVDAVPYTEDDFFGPHNKKVKMDGISTNLNKNRPQKGPKVGTPDRYLDGTIVRTGPELSSIYSKKNIKDKLSQRRRIERWIPAENYFLLDGLTKACARRDIECNPVNARLYDEKELLALYNGNEDKVNQVIDRCHEVMKHYRDLGYDVWKEVW